MNSQSSGTSLLLLTGVGYIGVDINRLVGVKFADAHRVAEAGL